MTGQGRLIDDYLSLDLCAISLYLSWALMLTDSKWIFKLCYFYSIGALFSLMIPELGGYGPDHFRYYHYFYVHGYIVWTSAYGVFVRGYTIKFRDMLIAFVILVPLGLLAMWVDFLVGANYMFLRHKPSSSSPLDMFGPWPQYIFGLIGLVTALFLIWYIPWMTVNLKNRKTLQAG